jgi:hypothetical protein
MQCWSRLPGRLLLYVTMCLCTVSWLQSIRPGDSLGNSMQGSHVKAEAFSRRCASKVMGNMPLDEKGNGPWAVCRSAKTPATVTARTTRLPAFADLQGAS